MTAPQLPSWSAIKPGDAPSCRVHALSCWEVAGLPGLALASNTNALQFAFSKRHGFQVAISMGFEKHTHTEQGTDLLLPCGIRLVVLWEQPPTTRTCCSRPQLGAPVPEPPVEGVTQQELRQPRVSLHAL